jgi:hypothetical protein
MPGRLQKSITSKPGEIVTPSEQSSVFRTLPFPHVGIFTFRPVFRFDGRFGNGTILDYGGSRWRGEDGLQGSEIVVVFVVTRQDLLDKAFRFGERQTRHDWVVFGLLSIFTGHSQRLALPRAWLKGGRVSYRHETASHGRYRPELQPAVIAGDASVSFPNDRVRGRRARARVRASFPCPKDSWPDQIQSETRNQIETPRRPVVCRTPVETRTDS